MAQRSPMKTLLISDVHIGYRYSRARDALAVLENEQYDRLILIGDIFDISNMMNNRAYWDEHHTAFLKKIFKLAKKIDVIYVAGNHDWPLKFLHEYTNKIAGIKICRSYSYESGGKTITCVHGDQYENIDKRLRKFGDLFYHIGLWFNKYINVVRKWFGKPYWSFSKWCKDKVKTIIMKSFDIESKMLDDNKESDIIVYGHTHMPYVSEKICNTGAFVEIATYIIESDGYPILHNLDND